MPIIAQRWPRSNTELQYHILSLFIFNCSLPQKVLIGIALPRKLKFTNYSGNHHGGVTESRKSGACLFIHVSFLRLSALAASRSKYGWRTNFVGSASEHPIDFPQCAFIFDDFNVGGDLRQASVLIDHHVYFNQSPKALSFLQAWLS